MDMYTCVPLMKLCVYTYTYDKGLEFKPFEGNLQLCGLKICKAPGLMINLNPKP